MNNSEIIMNSGNTQQGKQKKQYNDIGNYKTIGIYNSDFLKKINNKFKD